MKNPVGSAAPELKPWKVIQGIQHTCVVLFLQKEHTHTNARRGADVTKSPEVNLSPSQCQHHLISSSLQQWLPPQINHHERLTQKQHHCSYHYRGNHLHHHHPPILFTSSPPPALANKRTGVFMDDKNDKYITVWNQAAITWINHCFVTHTPV